MTITASTRKASALLDSLKEMSGGRINAGRLEEIAATANWLNDAGHSIEACNVLGMIAALRGDSLEVERCFNAAIQHGGNDAWTLGNYAAALNILVAGLHGHRREALFLQERAELEQRQPQFFDAASGCFYTLLHRRDGSYAIPFASDAIRELYGLEPEAAMNDFSALLALVHPDDIEMRQRMIEKSEQDLSPYRVEYRIIHPSRGIRWMEAHSLPQRTADGGTRWDGFMHDITGRKRMEEALAAREREFRSLAENVPDNIARWDAEGRILYSNPTHQRTLGKPASELIGKKHSEIFPDGRFSRGDAAVARIVASGKPEFLRETVPLGNGEIGIHAINFVPEFDESGRVVSVLAIGRDMTDVYRMQEVLAAREQEFRSLAESSPDFIARYGRDGRHRYLNATLVNLLGLSSAEEVIGRKASEVWTDGRFDKIGQAAEQAIESGSTQIIELTVPGDAGGFDYHQICVVPERDVAGAIVGTIAFGRDVTAIREAERRLKHFIDNLPGIAFTFCVAPGGHWSFPYISPSIHDYYGLQPEDVRNDAAALHALAHPDDQPRIEAAIAESERTVTPLRFEFRVCRPGVPERWLEVNSEPERQADGSLLWYGIMLDITGRKRIEEQLKLKEFALDRAHTAAYLMAEDGLHFVYVNDAACRSLGYSRDELLSLTLPDIDPYLSPEDARILDKLNAEGDAYSLESRHKRRDGSSFPMEVNVSVFEYQGRMLTLALVRDITERKQAERDLEDSRTQLRGLVSQREAAREEERKHIAREVHDNLGQILSGLRLNISRFSRRYAANSEDMRHDYQETVMLVEQAIKEVRNISAALRPVELDMGILAALEQHADRFAMYTGIECEVHAGKNAVLPDENHATALFRIAQESLTNVARHAQAKRVDISLATEADGCVLTVRDDGIGFDAGVKKMQSFGLVGMRERAAMLGGTVVVNSSPGRGAEIIVRIPVRKITEES